MEDQIILYRNICRKLAGTDFTNYRLRIIMALIGGATTPSAIADKTDIAQTQVRKIIRALVDENIVAIDKDQLPYCLRLLAPTGWTCDVKDVTL